MDIGIYKNYANSCGQASNIPDSCSEILEFKLGHVTSYTDWLFLNIP
jgi:hypothetical protein